MADGLLRMRQRPAHGARRLGRTGRTAPSRIVLVTVLLVVALAYPACSGDLRIAGQTFIRTKVHSGEYQVAQKMKHQHRCPDATVTQLPDQPHTYLAEGCGMSKVFSRTCSSHATGIVAYGQVGSRARCIYRALGAAETRELFCARCDSSCAESTSVACSGSESGECVVRVLCRCECRLQHGGCGQTLRQLTECMDLLREADALDEPEPESPKAIPDDKSTDQHESEQVYDRGSE